MCLDIINIYIQSAHMVCLCQWNFSWMENSSILLKLFGHLFYWYQNCFSFFVIMHCAHLCPKYAINSLAYLNAKNYNYEFYMSYHCNKAIVTNSWNMNLYIDLIKTKSSLLKPIMSGSFECDYIVHRAFLFFKCIT